jgi:hypothetical protein
MKRLLLVSLLTMSFSLQSYAVSCKTIKVLEDKLEKTKAQYNELESAVFLSDKLQEAATWAEWSNITETQRDGENFFSAKEVDILLMMDLLTDSKTGLYREMGSNAGIMAGTLAFNFVGARIINKLLDHGYKAGFMKKIQKLIIDDVDNKKKAQKVKHLATVLMAAAPIYIGIKEYQLYGMLQEAKRKLEVIEEVASDIPELSILEERVENDEIRLEELRAKLDEECI